MCSAGAINNYTAQLANYGSSKNQCKHHKRFAFFVCLHELDFDIFFLGLHIFVLKSCLYISTSKFIFASFLFGICIKFATMQWL